MNLIQDVIRLLQQGWCKGNRWKIINSRVHYDLMEAVYVCCKRSRTNGQRVLLSLIHEEVGSIVAFNDDPKTTIEDVVAMLRRIELDIQLVDNDIKTISLSGIRRRKLYQEERRAPDGTFKPRYKDKNTHII